MRIIEPREFQRGRKQRERLKKLRLFVAIATVVVLGVSSYSAYALGRPPRVISPQTIQPVTPIEEKISFAWPPYGQAAIGTPVYGVLADASPNEKPLPIASIAKVMTALAVLKKVPLEPGKKGPVYTITNADVALYSQYLSQGGSVTGVSEGEQITQYQALQAVLLPSANNLADSLAIKVFGSMENYVKYANNLAKTLGLNNTRISDASGFSDQTTSTAHDLVLMGIEALKHPVISEIIAQEQANIPVEGVVNNVNYLLGQDGIVGIKTGNTDQAGGCYLFAAVHQFEGGHKATVVGAILGAPNLGNALRDSLPLLSSSYKGFGNVAVVRAGQKVGSYKLPWGGTVQAVASRDLNVFGWKQSAAKPTVGLQAATVPSVSGSVVGSIGVDSTEGRKSVPVVTAGNISQAPKLWQLKHPN